MFKNLHKDNKGFTIIEVLIVLAIAGLIMLIVFLAIPALQRNQRNNARNADASRIAAAMGECLGNRNGVVASCTAAVITPLAGTRSELTGAITLAAGTGSTTAVNIQYGVKCLPDGSAGGGANPSPRDYAVFYQLETQGGTLNRCAGST